MATAQRKRTAYAPTSLHRYEVAKAAWIANNPGATHEQYQQAMADIARRCGV